MADPFFQNPNNYDIVVPTGDSKGVTVPPGKYVQGTYYSTLSDVGGLVLWSGPDPAPGDVVYIYNVSVGATGASGYSGFSGLSGYSGALTNIIVGAGVPVNGSSPDGTYFFRTNGSTNAHIYFAAGGAWVALV